MDYWRAIRACRSGSKTESLPRHLHERTVDLVINRMPGAFVVKQFDAETLYHDTISVVVGAGSPWAKRGKVQLADLVNDPWVLAKPEGPLWSYVKSAFEAEGLKPPPVAVTTNSYHARFSFLESGRFISVRASQALKLQGKYPRIKALRSSCR
jgi:DNA-binding transcriptional LysR family regulator